MMDLIGMKFDTNKDSRLIGGIANYVHLTILVMAKRSEEELRCLDFEVSSPHKNETIFILYDMLLDTRYENISLSQIQLKRLEFESSFGSH